VFDNFRFENSEYNCMGSQVVWCSNARARYLVQNKEFPDWFREHVGIMVCFLFKRIGKIDLSIFCDDTDHAVGAKKW